LYQDADDAYLTLCNAASLQDIRSYILGEGKNIKELFKRDPYSSGIFNYKVAYTVQEAFHEIELGGLVAVGGTNDE
jgi:hypothetical protein